MIQHTIKLEYRTWLARVVRLIDRLQLWFEQKTCPHLWRPVLTKEQPGRLCKICDLVQILSREDFYALFGECYQAMLYTKPINPVIRQQSERPFIETDGAIN